MRKATVLLGLVGVFCLQASSRGDEPDSLVLPALGVVQSEGAKEPAQQAAPAIKYQELHFRSREDCARRLVFSGGGGLYFMQPFFETNPAFGTASATFGPPTTITTTSQEDFGQNFDVAPMAWLGVSLEDGLGVKVRYFGYAQGSGFSFLTPAPAAGTTTIFYTPYPEGLGITNFAGTILDDRFDFFSDLRIQSWDLEVTQSWFGDTWQLQAAAGARLAYLGQDYRASFTPGPNNLVAGVSNVQSGHNFSGVGPLIALEGYVDIANTGLAVFCSSRNSILFGRARKSASGNVFDPTGALVATDSVNRQENEILPSSEIEFGLELGRRFNRTRLYTQIGVVGQMWWGAGNASNSDAITGTVFPVESNNTSVNLGMLGLLLRAGLDF